MIKIIDYPLKTEETPIIDRENNNLNIFSGHSNSNFDINASEERFSHNEEYKVNGRINDQTIDLYKDKNKDRDSDKVSRKSKSIYKDKDKSKSQFKKQFNRQSTRIVLIKNIIQENLNKSKKKKKREKSLFGKSTNKTHHELNCNEKFKKNFIVFYDKPAVIIYMSCLTLFALYLSDIQSAWCPNYADFPFDMIQLFVFLSFSCEICLCSYCDRGYFCSLFFWLDLISTLSLLIDVGFIFDQIIEEIFSGQAMDQARLTLSKISTASGTTRVLRILRIIKFIRLVKLYKTINQAKLNITRNKEMEKKRIKMLLLNSTHNESSTMENPIKSVSTMNINKWKINEGKDVNYANTNTNTYYNTNNDNQYANSNSNYNLGEVKDQCVNSEEDNNNDINVHDDHFVNSNDNEVNANDNNDNHVNVNSKDKLVFDNFDNKGILNNHDNNQINTNNQIENNHHNLNNNSIVINSHEYPVSPSLSPNRKLVLMNLASEANTQRLQSEINEFTLRLMTNDKANVDPNNNFNIKVNANDKVKADADANDEDNETENKDDCNHFAKVKTIEDISDDIIKESNISKVISSSLTNKIFFLVMIVLIVYPFLSDDFYYDQTDNISYQILGKYLDNYLPLSHDSLMKRAQYYISDSIDSFLPLINITFNSTLFYSNEKIAKIQFRSSEIKRVYSPSNLFELTYSIKNETELTAMLNVFRTLFVCILVGLSICLIEGETREYVLEPLEVMMEIVDKISHDPINAKNIEQIQSGTKATIDKMKKRTKQEEHKQYEILVIKQAIIKISSLLSMGFGPIGGNVIKKILYQEEGMSIKTKGKYVAGIYCSISLRNYNKIINSLRQKVIILNNELSEIIHTSIDRYSGCITRNLEHWQAIWKYSSQNPLMSHRYRSDKALGNNNANSNKDNKSLNKITSEEYSLLITNISDLALFSCCHIIRKVIKMMPYLEYLTDNIELSNYESNQTQFKVEMDFNLHSGLSIEGVIGSHLKLDVTHISNNIFITHLLKPLNQAYGVYILFTDTVYNNCSENLKMLCRSIDVIHFQFQKSRKYKLYTIDINTAGQMKEKTLLMLTKQEKEIMINEKKKEFYEKIRSLGNVSNYVLTKASFVNLFSVAFNDDFFCLWNQAFELYESGQWKNALALFKKCLSLNPQDRPGLFLVDQIEKNNCTAPPNWKRGRLVNV